MHPSISDKTLQDIILKLDDVLIIYFIIIIDTLDFQNSKWRLIQTKNISHDMSTDDLAANISQRESVLYN